MLKGYCGDQLPVEVLFKMIGWACGPMTQSEDANMSENN